jgi:hypothetical protein
MKDVVSRETMVEEIKSQLKAALETDYFVILRKKSRCVCFFGASPSKRMAWPIFLSY